MRDYPTYALYMEAVARGERNIRYVRPVGNTNDVFDPNEDDDLTASERQIARWQVMYGHS